MKKSLKALAVLAAAAIVTACGSSGGGTPAASESGGSAPAAESKAASPAASEEAAGGDSILNEPGTYPIVKEPVEMTMFRLQMPNVINFDDNDFTKFMEEKTGIKWKFETAGSVDSANEKVNLLMASGDYPDTFLFKTPDPAKFGVKEGILLPIDGMIEANMPNFTAYSKENTGLLGTITQTDGKIYTLPEINDCYHCQYRNKMWVNTMWLEKMGMEMPTTTEEFKAVCQKFLEINPDGIAVTGSIDGWGQQFQDFLINAFILVPGDGQNGTNSYKDQCVVSPDGKVMTIANTDEYREALRFMNELYAMKAIYDGSFTQNHEQLRTLMNQPGEPVLFVPYGTISDGVDSASNPETYAHYRVNPPIKGPGGKQYATYHHYDPISEDAFAITDTCEYPEAALRWADYFYTLEGYLSSQFGAEEGVDWVLNPEGKVGLGGGPAKYEIISTYSSEPQNHDWQDLTIKFATADIRLSSAVDPNVDISKPEGLEKLLFQETKEKMEPYGQKLSGDYDVLPKLKFTAEEITEIQTIGVELQKHIAENQVAFVTGAKSIDADWDAYIQGFDKVGLPKYLEVFQTAYDRQFSK